MITVAFYLPNAKFSNVDCTDIEKGNPGIGGTEYIIQIVAYYLNKRHSGQLNILLGANCAKNVNKSLRVIEVANITDLITAYPHEIDYVVFKHSDSWLKEATNAVYGTDIKLIPWAHNYLSRRSLSVVANNKYVERLVCVSKEQLNMYRDHKAFSKSSYIYNGMPVEYLKKYKSLIPSLGSRQNEVTYIGSIVDFKGFHLLAKAWKCVLTIVPNAKLNIIGSGNLYNKDSRLGRYNIAEESYENEFMPYLTDKDGKILPSVKFWGVLGVEKNDILARTRVGVPNPSGVSETFCITALEMQAMGALVTTIDFGGFRNTVYKTGLLYKDPKDLAECIIKQLQQTDNDIDGFYSWMEENFAFEKVVEDWMRLFESLKEKKQIKPLEYNNPNSDLLMQMREYNRKIKSVVGYWLPTIDFYRSILRRIGLVKGF